MSPSSSSAFSFCVISWILILSPVFLYLFQFPWRFAESSVLCHLSDSQSFFCFFISFKFLGVILEVAFFVTSLILILSTVFLYLVRIPWRFAESSVLCRFSDSHSLSYFSLSPSCPLAFFVELHFFFTFRILVRSPVFICILHVRWRSPGSCVLGFFSDFLSISCFSLCPSCSLRSPRSCVLCHFSDSHSISCFSLPPSSSLAFCWKSHSLSFFRFSIFLQFSFVSVNFVISRIFKIYPVFLYLLHVPKRSPGSCVLCHFSDSYSFSCFSLPPSSSLAFCWKSHSLSFFRFSIFLQFSFVSVKFFDILLEVQLFILPRILIRSHVFLYLLHVPWRFPGICVLCPFSDSQSLSSFYLSPSCS